MKVLIGKYAYTPIYDHSSTIYNSKVMQVTKAPINRQIEKEDVAYTHTHTHTNMLLFCCSVVSNSLWPTDCSMPGFLVHHHLPEFSQTHVHWVGDAIQTSHPLLSPLPPVFYLSQHQGLFSWVGFSHQVTKVLALELQHQSFQWIFRTHFLRIYWFDLLAVQGTLKSLF